MTFCWHYCLKLYIPNDNVWHYVDIIAQGSSSSSWEKEVELMNYIPYQKQSFSNESFEFSTLHSSIADEFQKRFPLKWTFFKYFIWFCEFFYHWWSWGQGLSPRLETKDWGQDCSLVLMLLERYNENFLRSQNLAFNKRSLVLTLKLLTHG